MRRDVFQAIADPTRRSILALLSKAPMNLNAIAGNFDISRPAISQQIKILSECGLVSIETVGRERYCSARLQGLRDVHDWTGQFRTFWTGKLDALGDFLEKESAPKKRLKSSTSIKKKRS